MATERNPRSSSPGYAGREPTQPPNWHGLVAWDFFLNAVSAGLFLVAAVGDLAAPAAFAGVSAWAYRAAFVVLLADLVCLVLDLGDPRRFHHMLRVFKPSSPMSLGTWLLNAFGVLLTLLVAIDLFAAPGWPRTVLVVVTLPFAFGVAAYKGVLFSTTAQPGWRDARWLGAYHVTSALAVGCGLTLVLAAVVNAGGAAGLLRPALVMLLVVGVGPLAILASELRPAVARRYSRRVQTAVVVLAFGGSAVAAGLALVPGLPTSAVAAALVLTGGWVVRRLVVLLPHAGHAVRQ